MFAFVANRRLTALCAKNASQRRSLGKLQVARCLSCPCRSPSHRIDYQVELVRDQLRRLVKVVEGSAFLLSLLRRLGGWGGVEATEASAERRLLSGRPALKEISKSFR
jgi:hypothetical protein